MGDTLYNGPAEGGNRLTVSFKLLGFTVVSVYAVWHIPRGDHTNTLFIHKKPQASKYGQVYFKISLQRDNQFVTLMKLLQQSITSFLQQLTCKQHLVTE